MSYIIQPRGERGERMARWMVRKNMAEEVRVHNNPISALFDGYVWVLTWIINKLLNAIEKLAIATATKLMKHKLQVRIVRR